MSQDVADVAEEIDGLINPIVEYDAEMTYEVAAFSAAGARAAAVDDDTDTDNVTRITAFSALAPEDDAVSDTAAVADIIDPDVDFGMIRQAAPENDFTLSYTFLRTETVNEILRCETRYIDDEERYTGDDEVVSEGSDGSRTVTYEIGFDADGTGDLETREDGHGVCPAGGACCDPRCEGEAGGGSDRNVHLAV